VERPGNVYGVGDREDVNCASEEEVRFCLGEAGGEGGVMVGVLNFQKDQTLI